ncbi:MAG: DUF547 domain-containing protein [Pseudomonadota bacterium]
MYKSHRLHGFAAAILLAITLAACHRQPAPQASFWSVSTGKYDHDIDHSQWQQVLDRYVVAYDNDVNRVDYRRLAETGMPLLNTYLTAMQDTDPRDYSRNEQMAYWINVYNAVTLQRVAQDWPTESILSLGGGLPNSGPWDETLFATAGKTLSLNDIEHKILRVVWQEPRVHFAVNCASIGCPDLSAKAFSGSTLETQLADAAVHYLASSRGVSSSKQTLTLSSIFDWYASDFGDSQAAVREYLASIADAPTATRLRRDYTDVSYDYDWTINATE